MSVLDVLDATRICGRWSDPDPAAWARPVAIASHRRPLVHRPHSWASFARNPKAILLTGLVAVDLARDAVLQALR